MRAKPRPWTKAERKRLRDYYPITPWPKLLAMFPGRSNAQLRHYARHIGLRRDHPTPIEIAQLASERRLAIARDYLAARAAEITACRDRASHHGGACLAFAACAAMSGCQGASRSQELT